MKTTYHIDGGGGEALCGREFSDGHDGEGMHLIALGYSMPNCPACWVEHCKAVDALRKRLADAEAALELLEWA